MNLLNAPMLALQAQMRPAAPVAEPLPRLSAAALKRR
jgi:hypothetical protein